MVWEWIVENGEWLLPPLFTGIGWFASRKTRRLKWIREQEKLGAELLDTVRELRDQLRQAYEHQVEHAKVLNEKRNTILRLQNELAASIQQNTELTQQIADLTEELAKMVRENQEMSARILDMEQRLTTLENNE